MRNTIEEFTLCMDPKIFGLRMSVERLEERMLEVLVLPPAVDEELLFLYFENKRRSGGGSLVSVEKKAAARVLSKGHHVLHNVELSVRKPASKDPCRLLLQGINPKTSSEMIELYLENMMDISDYDLHPSPGRESILIHLRQPFSKDFQNLSAKISRRTLDGAKVTLKQVEQTDSVLVKNLHPGTTPDLLTLYFENKGGGNVKVKEVTMLSEGTAKVSFVSYDSVDSVLDRPHKLEGADLVVKPYFDFLQPAQSLTSQVSAAGGQDVNETISEDLSDMQMQTSPPLLVRANSHSSSQTALELPAARETVELTVGKLALFELGTFQRDIEKAHPNITIHIKDNGVHVAGTNRQTFEQIKHSILDYFGKMTETSFTLESEKAEFFARKDVKQRLIQTLNQTGTPAVYTVSDCNVVVTSLSQNSAKQACSFLKSQLGHVSVPVDTEYEGIFYCREWSEFLKTLSFSSAKVPELGGNIDVLTLKGMESEKQAAILEFLSTPIERETVISMVPDMLKYIQIHCHQLLADMDQVSIFPLEAEDVCGLKIHGLAIACQMAEEVLQGVVSSICTRIITVNVPGVTRYLEDEECQSIMKEMERKFQVYINPKYVPWEPLPDQDIFETAWTLMSNKNFHKVSSDDAQELRSDHNGGAARGLLEEAKRIVSSIDERPEDVVSISDQVDNMDNVDLYSAEEPTDQYSDGIAVDTPSSTEGNSTNGLRQQNDDLEEEAQLSLAIQYSMESNHDWSLEDEEVQLQRALELSKKMMQQEASSSNKSPQGTQVKKHNQISLEDAIKSANTLQLHVFAGYSCDLIRVDIAFGKKVSQRQVEEKLEHRTLKNMSEYHMKCLEMIKRKHAVELQIQGTIITVSGFKEFVTAALCDVKLLLEKMSNMVPDQDILRVVQWVHYNPVSSKPIPYSPDATIFIENVWKMKLKKIDILLDNQPHTIDFEKMQEYNIASGKSVKISRKLVNLGDLGEDVPEEEYSLLSNLPEASKVDEESDEFQNVVKNFYETIQEYHSKIRIIQVEKLMNRLLYNQYKLKKASVLQRATYPEVERTLYHGTNETSVKEICVHGFNRSFCGKNATVYGQGVYFAVNSALSVQDQYSPPNADGYKFILVSKVLTGDYTKGCHSMKTAPLKETGNIPLRYDSVTDDITKPTMFVIFNDTQAFPEYLITCQRIHR
ncbi:Poly [ADP-ribose] polymerase 10 [Collichthys lucidus]|uniref:Poly [ADP-ribose] polymerase n=1 Tax=Collichthys lucidus TaxID=240159 RepID=A0A4U5VKC7_COLLU|nr:Poly [ADP-ribose] polymerase 10 [Collichthys lucidus]